MPEELYDHIAADSNAELAKLIDAIVKASIEIRIEFPHRMGFTDDTNKYGEQMLKLDAWTNQFLVDTILDTELVREVYSEELTIPAPGLPDAPYVVCMDPLDGSSNVMTNNTCGTIVSIYKNEIGRGTEQLAAFYKLYGPVTTMTYTVGKGVHEFMQHLKDGVHFALSKEKLMLPDEGGVFGIGGKRSEMAPRLAQFVDSLESRGMKLRYSGTLCADFNQVIRYGGLFAYSKPKLRLNYEAKPLAFLIQQAGGASSNGFKSLLEVEDEIDARTPVFLGSKTLIEEIHGLNR